MNGEHKKPVELPTEELSVAACKLYPDEWLVEEIGTDGEVYVARFTGQKARERAIAYVGLRSFALAVSRQKPEKPDYWSSCSQCYQNIDAAEDLVEAHAHG